MARGGGWSVTIGGSIALIIIGAVLTWGVSWKPAHVDLEVIGIILMCGGGIGLILSLVFAMRRSSRGSSADVHEERRYTEPPGYTQPPAPPTGP
jgi:hypothetical protein